MIFAPHRRKTGSLKKETVCFLQIIYQQKLVGHFMNLIDHLSSAERNALFNMTRYNFANVLTNTCIDICRHPIRIFLFHFHLLKMRRDTCSDNSESTKDMQG